MERIDLIKQEHNTRIGDRCGTIVPNITEDSMFFENGKEVGFYLKDLNNYSPRLVQLIDIANREFLSPRVPKTILDRSDVLKFQIEHNVSRSQARKMSTVQMSTILGAIPPKAQFRRNYITQSAVHNVESAKPFIKAMLMARDESEAIIQKLLPELYEQQKKLIAENCPEPYRFGKLFTSAICNYNIAAPFHRDSANIIGCVNVIITKRNSSTGGNTTVPDYGATFGSGDNSMLVYPAWKNVHGVTPIVETKKGGYRNSFVFYPLKSFREKTEEEKQKKQKANVK